MFCVNGNLKKGMGDSLTSILTVNVRKRALSSVLSSYYLRSEPFRLANGQYGQCDFVITQSSYASRKVQMISSTSSYFTLLDWLHTILRSLGG